MSGGVLEKCAAMAIVADEYLDEPMLQEVRMELMTKMRRLVESRGWDFAWGVVTFSTSKEAEIDGVRLPAGVDGEEIVVPRSTAVRATWTPKARS